MAMSERDSTPHPGRILLQRAMEPLGISRNQLARDLDVPVGRISDITNGKRGITADTALRLGRYFSTGPEIWLRMQAEYDLSVARASTWSAIEERVRVLADAEVDSAMTPPVAAAQRIEPSAVEAPVIINPAPPRTPPDGAVAVSAEPAPTETVPADPAPADPTPPEVPQAEHGQVLELREAWGRDNASRDDDLGIPPVPGDRAENP